MELRQETQLALPKAQVQALTVGSKTVAMFEGFAVGEVWHLGAWEWRLVLVGLGKVLLLGYQTSF